MLQTDGMVLQTCAGPHVYRLTAVRQCIYQADTHYYVSGIISQHLRMFKMHALQVMVPTTAFAQDEGSDRMFTDCNY